jgi:D-alanyl-D-alanine endopeptidase (penicillin-binding protein 7)
MIRIFILLALLALLPIYSSAAEILARAWLITDAQGRVIDQKNMNTVQPIASITKLMTAMVVLDTNEPLNEEVRMRKFRGIRVTRHQLLDLAIIHSDNQAADMLCKIYRRGYQRCIQDMNNKAQILGMTHTEFYDATGRDNRNVGNATDLIKLLQAAERYPEIVNASKQTIVELTKKHQRWRFNNTNPLVAKYDVIVSKTGYVRASGGCLVMSVRIRGEKRYVVVLNSNTTRTRIHDMETLILSLLEKEQI